MSAVKSGRRENPRKKVPAWLMGLFFAAIVFIIILLVVNALGYGDDPAVGALGGGRLRPFR
jgi:hypothetical protein